jgi:hypothetical protein
VTRAPRLALLAAASLLACEPDPPPVVGSNPPPAAPLTTPTQLCRSRGPDIPCRDAREVEELLARADLEIVGAAKTPAGIQGARVLTLRAPGPGVVFRAKWRAHSTTSKRNSPRRELAAYAVQKLFLDPDEYVVPPTAAHCFPLAPFRKLVDRKARATFRDVPCVYGILSYWLEDVQSLKGARRAGWFDGVYHHALDLKLFEDNETYRASIADVNLFTYLIGHSDSHQGNFVITLEPDAPLVYSVDNSLSLGLPKNRKLKPHHDWSHIQVPALRRGAIDRLRKASDAVERLGTVAVLEVKKGQLVQTKDSGGPPSLTGLDLVGDRLSVGLTSDEIAGVRRRIAELMRRLDRGQVRLY